MITKKLPKELQDYADWFKEINNVMNKIIKYLNNSINDRIFKYLIQE